MGQQLSLLAVKDSYDASTPAFLPNIYDDSKQMLPSEGNNSLIINEPYHKITDTSIPRATSTITQVLPSYQQRLEFEMKSRHTIESFVSDIRILSTVIGDMALNAIEKRNLEYFISHLVNKKQSKKTIYRRAVAIKNFFGWLHREKILDTDPSLKIVVKRTLPPLPKILNSEETDHFIEAAKGNPLSHILALLLLCAGLKRNDISTLKFEDININDKIKPYVHITSSDPFKEREVDLPVEFVPSYIKYMESNKTGSNIIFSQSERNINNILKEIATRAGISKKVSCQILRDSYAVQCLRAGLGMEAVLKRLGLSQSGANEEIRRKLKKLLETR